MKIQCQVCSAAEAAVLCCADEAALCAACDDKVHAANKLASKHPRVSISNSSTHMPKCDICQDMTGFFFCLEDRALLCRKCDIAIHTANSFVSAHQRFLLTGVKVGLEPIEPRSSSSSSSAENPLTAGKVSELKTHPLPQKAALKSLSAQQEKSEPVKSSAAGNLTPSKRSATMSFSGDFSKMLPVQDGGVADFMASRLPYSGGSVTGSLLPWHMDDFLGLSDLNQSFGSSDRGSSKADNGKLGQSDSSSVMRSSEDDVDVDERLGRVPDGGWTVPQVASPPTASGLQWPKGSHDPAAFVPDISWTHLQTSHPHWLNPTINKRHRQ